MTARGSLEARGQGSSGPRANTALRWVNLETDDVWPAVKVRQDSGLYATLGRRIGDR